MNRLAARRLWPRHKIRLTGHPRWPSSPALFRGLNSQAPPTDDRWDEWKTLMDAVPISTEPEHYAVGRLVTIKGFLGKRRNKGSVSQCDLHHESGTLRLVCAKDEEAIFEDLKSIPAHSPVTVDGWVGIKQKKQDLGAPPKPIGTMMENLRSTIGGHEIPSDTEVKIKTIRPLNIFPKDIIVSEDAVWPPKHRHLQMRFDQALLNRLKVRNHLQSMIRQHLQGEGFTEVETPILFKSTPEGAREFLVPTRRQGMAYALPQSPQQYKQILMAGGLRKYFQFAKCFRDEDHRADRQPEFTQMDMEMSFADGEDVRRKIQSLIFYVWSEFQKCYKPVQISGVRQPVERRLEEDRKDPEQDPDIYLANIRKVTNFVTMPYHEAMARFGTDKPDLRLHHEHVSELIRVDDMLRPDFVNMITKLEKPIVEAFKIRLPGATPAESSRFIAEFMDALPSSPLKLSPESSSGVFVYDSARPIQGLSALGFEAAEEIADMDIAKAWTCCEDGDIIIMHARKNEAFRGGSIDIGRLRLAIYEDAVSKGLIPKDEKFYFVWVHSFPLFTPDGDDPGQGGSAGFSATHHPFTAPLFPQDLEKIRQGQPLQAVGDSYDLVLNGVEIGGGSRRIHVADLQEYIMRDVLQMTDVGVGQFSHLLEALRAGCPPHAGFALGFDRLVSVLCGVDSVRDVIAFPKNNKGQDLLVGSPNKTTPDQQKTYHLFRDEPSKESQDDV